MKETALPMIRLNEIKAFASIGDVPLGRIIQFIFMDEMHVGMKAEFKAGGDIFKGVAIVGGGRCGEFLPSDALISAIIDINELVDLVALEPGNAKPLRHVGRIPKGLLAKSLRVETVFYMWATLSQGHEEAPVGAWVCVQGSSKDGVNSGAYLPGLDISLILPVAASLGIARKIMD